VVLSAPHFVTKKGPGTAVDPELFARWAHFDLADALAKALGKPTKVANDADVQGAAVVQGKGLELVITLGTGFGTAVFMDGALLPSSRVRPSPLPQGRDLQRAVG
jgi:polyphosphate glucokinase